MSSSINSTEDKINDKLTYPYWQPFGWILKYLINYYSISIDKDTESHKAIALAAKDIHNELVRKSITLEPIEFGKPESLNKIFSATKKQNVFTEDELELIDSAISTIQNGRMGRLPKIKKFRKLYHTAIDKEMSPVTIATLGIISGSSEASDGPLYGLILAADASGALAGGSLGGPWGALGGAVLCSTAAALSITQEGIDTGIDYNR